MEVDGYLFIGNMYVLRVDKFRLNRQFKVEKMLDTFAPPQKKEKISYVV